MPKITTTEQEVRSGLERYVKQVREEGAEIDTSNADIDKLICDINDEYAHGADGSAYDIITDLADSVGLEEYKVYING